MEEVFAFEAERFGLGDVEAFGFGLFGHRDVVLPADGVRVEEQLVGPRARVVEHGHLAVSHHHELLHLERVEPRHEDVGSKPGRKFEVRGGDVGDAPVQVVASRGLDGFGFFAGKSQDHGDVVGGEGPEDVFLAAYLAKVQPVRIDVVDASEFSRCGQFLEPRKDRVVMEQVADHEHQAAGAGEIDEFAGFVFAKNQGLFDVQVPAREDHFTGDIEMGFGGSGDGDSRDVRPGKHVVQGQARVDARVLFAEGSEQGFVLVADERKGTQLVIVAHEIAAPVAGADHGDAWAGGRGCGHGKSRFKCWVSSVERPGGVREISPARSAKEVQAGSGAPGGLWIQCVPSLRAVNPAYKRQARARESAMKSWSSGCRYGCMGRLKMREAQSSLTGKSPGP